MINYRNKNDIKEELESYVICGSVEEDDAQKYIRKKLETMQKKEDKHGIR